MIEGDTGVGQNKTAAIEALLEAFEDDSVAAVRGVRNYIEQLATKEQRRVRPASANPVLLAVKDVSKTYKLGRQKLEVLRGISLEVREGEFIAITGASGSGKSTLLQLMGGLDKPSEGEV